MGVEFVSGQLFDGQADRARLVQVDVGDGSRIIVIPPEDVIADRLGQHAAAPATDRTQLALARMVYSLAERLDETYLLHRVQNETGSAMSAEEMRELLSQ